MSDNLPILLQDPSQDNFPATVDTELEFLSRARKLLDSAFPDHSLLDIWNAAVHNLRRRVETYGIDLFTSAVKDEAGRKKYDKDGETINERWAGVDKLTLISGATKLGVFNKKAGKSLEMINWMRNHASPESIFRKCKYRPAYPYKGFENITQARESVLNFTGWYNREHRHSGIKFVTPYERHAGHDIEILKAREALYEQAKQKHPQRWSGSTRNWAPVEHVWLNPEKQSEVL